jgi:head-tail adaptor
MAKAAEQLGAGDFRNRVRFDKHGEQIDDGSGNFLESGWDEQFTRWAALMPMRGGEGLIADRLEGLGPAVLVVRLDSETRTITPEWRAVDLRPDGTEHVYAIKDARDMEMRGRHMTMLVELGSPA